MRSAADWAGQGRLGANATHRVSRLHALYIDRWMLSQIHHRLHDEDIRLQLWDGTAVGARPGAARVTVSIADRTALYGLVWDAEMTFGDAYSDGRIEVAGDLAHLLEVAYRAPGGRLIPWRPRLPSNSLRRAWDNVHRHYDLGNDFYRLWLDEQMVYTCAYFPNATATLEQAQEAKLELVCRKLALEPGLRVVEAGSGWGALALYMARHYGVSVRAYNVSHEQVAYARAKAEAAGLAGQVEFVEDDYRRVSGSFDRFVSVGMLEHVGVEQYAALGEVIDRVLDRERGRGLLHFIGRNHAEPLCRWITSRIFPGAYPPTVGEVARAVLEPRRLSVLDVENLRPHYARTLEHWIDRYASARGLVARTCGERFARAWHLYLVGSRVGFTTGSLQLFQVTFAREHDNTVPWTRVALYEP